jgi:integrase
MSAQATSPLDTVTSPATVRATEDGSPQAFIARTKIRQALKMLPARAVPTTALPTAAQLLRDAAELLDQEHNERALAVARGESDYDPDAILFDVRGRRRRGSNMPGYLTGREPANKGKSYPPDPPPLEDIMALLNACADTPFGHRMAAFILITWRSGLRISEVLRIAETDLQPNRGCISVRRSKNGTGGEAGIDDWVWPLLTPWLEDRKKLDPGPLFCVIDGVTAGVRAWNSHQVRVDLKRLAATAGVRRRIAPHQLRHAHTVELVKEGTSLAVVQRQLGHANLQVTSIYLRSLPQQHVIDAIRSRNMPTVPAFALPGLGR